MKFLITGGAGYIGSVTNWRLRSQGHDTVIFDNLNRGYRAAIGDTRLIVGDLRNKEDIGAVFEKEQFDAVIHFAALALAGESMQQPYDYIHNNVDGGLNLLEAMRLHGCRNIIFSSTCAVYGFPKKLPVTEDESIAPVSIYGASKRMFEETLFWYEKVHGIQMVILRYFNAAGAVIDGSIGEAHMPETHIVPAALSVAIGKSQAFEVFGTDYATPDGTCIRDYIHVLDLADAHIKAAEYIQERNESLVVNLGVGRGYSNLEVIAAVEKATGKHIPLVQKPRRWGDPDAIFADNKKARQVLKWNPQFASIDSIVESAWAWHKTHPDGYTQ